MVTIRLKFQCLDDGRRKEKNFQSSDTAWDVCMMMRDVFEHPVEMRHKGTLLNASHARHRSLKSLGIKSGDVVYARYDFPFKLKMSVEMKNFGLHLTKGFKAFITNDDGDLESGKSDTPIVVVAENEKEEGEDGDGDTRGEIVLYGTQMFHDLLAVIFYAGRPHPTEEIGDLRVNGGSVIGGTSRKNGNLLKISDLVSYDFFGMARRGTSANFDRTFNLFEGENDAASVRIIGTIEIFKSCVSVEICACDWLVKDALGSSSAPDFETHIRLQDARFRSDSGSGDGTATKDVDITQDDSEVSVHTSLIYEGSRVRNVEVESVDDVVVEATIRVTDDIDTKTSRRDVCKITISSKALQRVVKHFKLDDDASIEVDLVDAKLTSGDRVDVQYQGAGNDFLARSFETVAGYVSRWYQFKPSNAALKWSKFYASMSADDNLLADFAGTQLLSVGQLKAHQKRVSPTRPFEGKTHSLERGSRKDWWALSNDAVVAARYDSSCSRLVDVIPLVAESERGAVAPRSTLEKQRVESLVAFVYGVNKTTYKEYKHDAKEDPAKLFIGGRKKGAIDARPSEKELVEFLKGCIVRPRVYLHASVKRSFEDRATCEKQGDMLSWKTLAEKYRIFACCALVAIILSVCVFSFVLDKHDTEVKMTYTFGVPTVTVRGDATSSETTSSTLDLSGVVKYTITNPNFLSVCTDELVSKIYYAASCEHGGCDRDALDSVDIHLTGDAPNFSSEGMCIRRNEAKSYEVPFSLHTQMTGDAALELLRDCESDSLLALEFVGTLDFDLETDSSIFSDVPSFEYDTSQVVPCVPSISVDDQRTNTLSSSSTSSASSQANIPDELLTKFKLQRDMEISAASADIVSAAAERARQEESDSKSSLLRLNA
eukprot:g335.t1